MTAEPRFEKLDAMALIGVPFYGDPAGGQFADAWHRFALYMETVPGAIPGPSYGVELYPQDFESTHKWAYVAATPVTSLDEIPLGLVGIRLPACEYAVFTLKGPLDGLHDMFQHAYHTWLPNSGYEIARRFDLERYDERFRPNDPERSEVDICLPVRRKGA